MPAPFPAVTRVSRGRPDGGQFSGRRRDEAETTLPVEVSLPVGVNFSRANPGEPCTGNTAFVVRKNTKITYLAPTEEAFRGVYPCAVCGHPAAPVERSRPWNSNKPWRRMPHLVPVTSEVIVALGRTA